MVGEWSVIDFVRHRNEGQLVKSNLDRIESVVRTIVHSPLIAEYKIGITKNPLSRRRQYRSVGFDGYVILDTRLTSEEALAAEEELFHRLTGDKRRMLFQKFRHTARSKPHVRSLGGARPSSQVKYDLYLAWIEH